MTRLTLAFVVLLAACGGGDKAKLTKIKDDICACPDMACVKKVEADAEKFVDEMKKKYTKDSDIPKDLMEVGEELDKCEQKIRKAEEEKAADGVLDTLKGFKDKMCACKDKACGDKVNDEMTKKMNDLATTEAAMKKPSEETIKKATEVMKDYSDCQVKVQSAQ